MVYSRTHALGKRVSDGTKQTSCSWENGSIWYSPDFMSIAQGQQMVYSRPHALGKRVADGTKQTLCTRHRGSRWYTPDLMLLEKGSRRYTPDFMYMAQGQQMVYSRPHALGKG